MKFKILLLSCILLAGLTIIGCASDSDDDKAVTSCDQTTFKKDDSIQSLCGLTTTGNHVVIKGLQVPAGEEFVLYARTSATGDNGVTYTFDGDSAELTVAYKDSTATGSTVSINSMQNWLFGIFEESPAVHIIVKNSNDANQDPEDYTSVIDIEPDEWTAGAPASTSFYYRATSGVTISSVKVFFEEHDHEE